MSPIRCKRNQPVVATVYGCAAPPPKPPAIQLVCDAALSSAYITGIVLMRSNALEAPLHGTVVSIVPQINRPGPCCPATERAPCSGAHTRTFGSAAAVLVA